MSEARRFFDTNILVYAFLPGDPLKMEQAQTLMGETVESTTGVISYQVWQEFASVAIRKFKVKASALEVMEVFNALSQTMQTVQSSERLFAAAVRLWSTYSLAWYDALIVAAALEGRCDVLYSEDLQDGLEIDGLRIVNPFR